MDAIASIKHYLEKIINDPLLEGMKVLLLDAETTTIVSMVMSQSEILQKEVFLVEQLDATASHEPMLHLKAAVFVRPTSANVELLRKELKHNRYGQYHLFFANILSVESLEKLAEADDKELVVQIQEYYADFLAVNDCLFHFNLKQSVAMSIKPGLSPLTTLPNVVSAAGINATSSRTSQLLDRSVEGMLSLLLSLKKRPMIRYQKGSDIAEKLAREVSARMQLEQDGLFDFRRPEVMPLLYVLDRKDDPVTPLLSQWTYQAMVHELLGLYENRVSLATVPNVRKDMLEVVLSVTSDQFFGQNMTANFGDLGLAVKKLVDEYQQKTQMHENIESIEDMQRFLENFPAFRSQSVTVSKHVTLMGELARLIEADCLMDVSQLEQDIACSDDHNNHFKELVAKIKNPQIKAQNKLRLAILYALRYESHSSVQLKLVKELLTSHAGLSNDKVLLVDQFLKYGGANARNGDLFGDKGLTKKFMRAMAQGLNGVSNVYAQHVPPLIKYLEQILKGQLLDNEFCIVNGPSATPGIKKVKDVVVFICGGVTFEEATKVAELNQKLAASGQNQRILLGGTTILNSSTFLNEIADAFGLESSGGNVVVAGNSNSSRSTSGALKYDGKSL